jgi:hypothetical protein
MSDFTIISTDIDNAFDQLKNSEEDLVTITKMNELITMLQSKIETIKVTVADKSHKLQEKVEAEVKKAKELLEKLSGKTVKVEVEKPQAEKPKVEKPQVAPKISWADITDDEEKEKEKPFIVPGKKKPVKSVSFAPTAAECQKIRIPGSGNIDIAAIPITNPAEAYNHVGNMCFASETERFVVCLQVGELKVLIEGMPSNIVTDGKPYKFIKHRPMRNYPKDTPFYVPKSLDPSSKDVRHFYKTMNFVPASQENDAKSCCYRLGSIDTLEEDLAVISDDDMELFHDLAGHYFLIDILARMYFAA